jgi:hypothetical protein
MKVGRSPTVGTQATAGTTPVQIRIIWQNYGCGIYVVRKEKVDRKSIIRKVEKRANKLMVRYDFWRRIELNINVLGARHEDIFIYRYVIG